MYTLFLDLAVVSVHSKTFVEGVPPSKHFRCITRRYVLRSPITQPNIPKQNYNSTSKSSLQEPKECHEKRRYTLTFIYIYIYI